VLVPVLVIGGSGKDVGKTSLVCAVISALAEFDWTVVKITGHDYAAGIGEGDEVSDTGLAIREETRAGEETDTARYLTAGARRALLVTRVGEGIPVEEIRNALGSHRNVIFESNRIVDAVKPDVCLALVGGTERKGSFTQLLRVTDAVVIVGGAEIDGLPEGIRRFELERADRVSAELVEWLRERLDQH
jgi:hypothetical protein